MVGAEYGVSLDLWGERGVEVVPRISFKLPRFLVPTGIEIGIPWSNKNLCIDSRCSRVAWLWQNRDLKDIIEIGGKSSVEKTDLLALLQERRAIMKKQSHSFFSVYLAPDIDRNAILKGV